MEIIELSNWIERRKTKITIKLRPLQLLVSLPTESRVVQCSDEWILVLKIIGSVHCATWSIVKWPKEIPVQLETAFCEVYIGNRLGTTAWPVAYVRNGRGQWSSLVCFIAGSRKRGRRGNLWIDGQIYYQDIALGESRFFSTECLFPPPNFLRND